MLVWRNACLARTKLWVLSLSPHKPAVRAHASNPSALEVQAGGLEVQGHSWLYIQFEASLGYTRPCLNEEEEEKTTCRTFLPKSVSKAYCSYSFNFSRDPAAPTSQASIADLGIPFPIILALPVTCVPSETDVECICRLPWSGITQLRLLAPQRRLQHCAGAIPMRTDVLLGNPNRCTGQSG